MSRPTTMSKRLIYGLCPTGVIFADKNLKNVYDCKRVAVLFTDDAPYSERLFFFENCPAELRPYIECLAERLDGGAE